MSTDERKNKRTNECVYARCIHRKTESIYQKKKKIFYPLTNESTLQHDTQDTTPMKYNFEIARLEAFISINGIACNVYEYSNIEIISWKDVNNFFRNPIKLSV